MARKLKGKIVSDKMQKTRVVAVTRLKLHSKYRKHYKITERFKAHDDKNDYKVGEEVVIEECRPISKEKKWRIISRIIQK